jgi:hypothetical protein
MEMQQSRRGRFITHDHARHAGNVVGRTDDGAPTFDEAILSGMPRTHWR